MLIKLWAKIKLAKVLFLSYLILSYLIISFVLGLPALSEKARLPNIMLIPSWNSSSSAGRLSLGLFGSEPQCYLQGI